MEASRKSDLWKAAGTLVEEAKSGDLGSVEKAGRKISLSRMEKLRNIMTLVQEIIDEMPVEKNEGLKTSVLKVDESKRLVTGIVLEPEVVDTQGDIVDADEIENAAHDFLVNSRRVGLQHRAEGPVDIVESFIVQKRSSINGVDLEKGTWVIVVKVRDDILWDVVKRGGYSGFSIGGRARRVEME